MCPLSLDQAVEMFLDWMRPRVTPETLYGYALYLRRFVTHAGVDQLRHVTTVHVITFGHKFHPLQSVKRFLRWCRRTARIAKKDAGKNVKLPRIGRRRRVLTRKEELQLLRNAADRYRYVLLALRESIARPKEMRTVSAAQIRRADGALADAADLVAGRCLFLLDDWKTRGRDKQDRAWREIPISPRLGRLIVRLLARRSQLGGPLFVNSLGLPWTANALRCAMRRLRVRAGMVAGPGGERVCNYHWRHTGATRLVRQGENLAIVQKILGHEQITTTQRYVHPDREDMLGVLRRRAPRRQDARE